MVTVPFFVPDTKPLQNNPLFLSYEDRFTKPNPFQADIVIGIDDVIEKKLDAMMALESQFYEGGANGGPQNVPSDPAAIKKRQAQVRDQFRGRFASPAKLYRAKLVELYGKAAGEKIQYAEAFEISEYGGRPNAARIRQLFPMLPANPQ